MRVDHDEPSTPTRLPDTGDGDYTPVNAGNPAGPVAITAVPKPAGADGWGVM